MGVDAKTEKEKIDQQVDRIRDMIEKMIIKYF